VRRAFALWDERRHGRLHGVAWPSLEAPLCCDDQRFGSVVELCHRSIFFEGRRHTDKEHRRLFLERRLELTSTAARLAHLACSNQKVLSIVDATAQKIRDLAETGSNSFPGNLTLPQGRHVLGWTLAMFAAKVVGLDDIWGSLQRVENAAPFGVRAMGDVWMPSWAVRAVEMQIWQAMRFEAPVGPVGPGDAHILDAAVREAELPKKVRDTVEFVLTCGYATPNIVAEASVVRVRAALALACDCLGWTAPAGLLDRVTGVGPGTWLHNGSAQSLPCKICFGRLVEATARPCIAVGHVAIAREFAGRDEARIICSACRASLTAAAPHLEGSGWLHPPTLTISRRELTSGELPTAVVCIRDEDHRCHPTKQDRQTAFARAAVLRLLRFNVHTDSVNRKAGGATTTFRVTPLASALSWPIDAKETSHPAADVTANGMLASLAEAHAVGLAHTRVEEANRWFYCSRKGLYLSWNGPDMPVARPDQAAARLLQQSADVMGFRNVAFAMGASARAMRLCTHRDRAALSAEHMSGFVPNSLLSGLLWSMERYTEDRALSISAALGPLLPKPPRADALTVGASVSSMKSSSSSS